MRAPHMNRTPANRLWCVFQVMPPWPRGLAAFSKSNLNVAYVHFMLHSQSNARTPQPRRTPVQNSTLVEMLNTYTCTCTVIDKNEFVELLTASTTQINLIGQKNKRLTSKKWRWIALESNPNTTCTHTYALLEQLLEYSSIFTRNPKKNPSIRVPRKKVTRVTSTSKFTRPITVQNISLIFSFIVGGGGRS